MFFEKSMLQKLYMQHFRNYSRKEILFSHPLTIITGDNGKGKTNILEAVSALAFIKPFRSGKKEIFIEHNANFARLVGETSENETLEIFWGLNIGDAINIRRNDLVVSSKEYLRHKSIKAVVFSPEDLNLPVLSPQYRRDFLSRLLSSLFPEYFESALQYKAVLKNRNILLKKYAEGKVQQSEFIFWNTELAKHYNILSKKHELFFKFANKNINAEYISLSGKNDDIGIQPIKSLQSNMPFTQALEESFEKDVFKGSTSLGIHRDDFSLFIRDTPVQENASRGEMRSAILALKKIEQEFIKQHSHTTPILLLDDVFSELDHAHQKHLLSSLDPKQQCIITTTSLEIDIPKDISFSHIQL